jgi:hypothetical protein
MEAQTKAQRLAAAGWRHDQIRGQLKRDGYSMQEVHDAIVKLPQPRQGIQPIWNQVPLFVDLSGKMPSESSIKEAVGEELSKHRQHILEELTVLKKEIGGMKSELADLKPLHRPIEETKRGLEKMLAEQKALHSSVTALWTKIGAVKESAGESPAIDTSGIEAGLSDMNNRLENISKALQKVQDEKNIPATPGIDEKLSAMMEELKGLTSGQATPHVSGSLQPLPQGALGWLLETRDKTKQLTNDVSELRREMRTAINNLLVSLSQKQAPNKNL